MKIKRDRGHLDFIKKQPCIICGTTQGIDPHHVTSVGAGGTDKQDNVIPLCRKHHSWIHCVGLFEAIREYSIIYRWLILHKREDIISKFDFYESCRMIK